MSTPLEAVRRWHAEEGHPGPLELCGSRLCSMVAETLREKGSGPDYWPGHLEKWGHRDPR